MTNTSPNPFNPEALRLSPSVNSAGVEKLLNRVLVQKPNKQDWNRVHPDAEYRLDIGIIDLKEDGQKYAVTQELQSELADLMVPVTLYTAITRQGTVFLWPVRLPTDDGKTHDAWTSSHEAAEIATKTWTRLQWNASLGSYDMFVATGIPVEPVWPIQPFAELLKIAFQGKIVDSPDHLVVRKLRGQA